jgi:hypothetical protein
MVPRISSYAQQREADARAYFRDLGNAELHAASDSYRYTLAEAEDYDRVNREVVHILSGSLLRLVKEELARRESLFAAGRYVPDPHATEYLAWCDLAREVKEQADIVHWLQVPVGGRLRPTGAREWHGWCPVCRDGEDRFVVWPADGSREGRYWCRRCGTGGDVITAYRELVVPGASFFDAVRVLAAELGFRTPDWGSQARANVPARSRRRVVRLQAVARHAG